VTPSNAVSLLAKWRWR